MSLQPLNQQIQLDLSACYSLLSLYSTSQTFRLWQEPLMMTAFGIRGHACSSGLLQNMLQPLMRASGSHWPLMLGASRRTHGT